MAEDEPVISYSVRDLLTKMDGKLDAIGVQLGSKANTVRVDQVANSVNDLQERMTAVEATQKQATVQATTRLANRQWLIPTGCGAVVALVEILQALHIHLG